MADTSPSPTPPVKGVDQITATIDVQVSSVVQFMVIVEVICFHGKHIAFRIINWIIRNL